MNGSLFLQLIQLLGGQTFGFWYDLKTYTITYNVNGGAWTDGTTTNKTATKTHGTALTIISEAPKKTGGYVFKGWSTSSTATSSTYAAGGSFTTNANTTLYAVYQEATVSKITLSLTGTKWVLKGNSFNIKATVTMSDSSATPKPVTWYADDSTKVSFSSSTSASGAEITVTGVSKGQTAIYAYTEAYVMYSSALTVNVADMMSNSTKVEHYALSTSTNSDRTLSWRPLFYRN